MIYFKIRAQFPDADPCTGTHFQDTYTIEMIRFALPGEPEIPAILNGYSIVSLAVQTDNSSLIYNDHGILSRAGYIAYHQPVLITCLEVERIPGLYVFKRGLISVDENSGRRHNITFKLPKQGGLAWIYK